MTETVKEKEFRISSTQTRMPQIRIHSNIASIDIIRIFGKIMISNSTATEPNRKSIISRMAENSSIVIRPNRKTIQQEVNFEPNDYAARCLHNNLRSITRNTFRSKVVSRSYNCFTVHDRYSKKKHSKIYLKGSLESKGIMTKDKSVVLSKGKHRFSKTITNFKAAKEDALIDTWKSIISKKHPKIIKNVINYNYHPKRETKKHIKIKSRKYEVPINISSLDLRCTKSIQHSEYK